MRKTFLPLTALFFALALLFVAPHAIGQNNKDRIKRNYDIFSAVVYNLDQNYVDTIEVQKMFDRALIGLMSPLDPYTVFFDEQETRDFLQTSNGEYGGIGAYIQKTADEIILSPIEGSPAAQAGLRGGDRLLAADGKDVRGLESEAVTSLIKGMPGTDVNLRIFRPYVDTDSIFDVTVTRAMLISPTVTYAGVDKDGIGYVDLTQFSDNSAEEMRKALEGIIADKNLKGLVLDLADNGGGRLEAAIDILGMFVPKGTTVLTTKGRTKEKSYATTTNPIVPQDLPLVVLINGNTASASEVVAGALQDLDRAVLVGKRSFGKGLVQTTLPMPYNTMLKVTTSKYYIPSGRLIQAYDYSRRNEDGSVKHVPDSLAKAFLTKGGRTVYDGGGLTPDREVPSVEINPILYPLYEKNLITDYATKYMATHPTIASPEEFRITDEIFEDFKEFADVKNLQYTSEAQDALKSLRDTLSEKEKADSTVTEQLDMLEQALVRDPEKDIDEARSAIEPTLSSIITENYYYARGRAQNFLNYDKGYKLAKEILLDKPLYDSILSGEEAVSKSK